MDVSWTIKKTEHWIIDTFELWCWRSLLIVPWTARSSNQSILKETSPKYSLEGLKLKFQYFGRLIWRTDSNEKAPMLGLWRQDWRQEKKGMAEGEMVWFHHWFDGLRKLGVGDGQGSLMCCSPWGRKESQLRYWTELITLIFICPPVSFSKQPFLYKVALTLQ